MSSDTTGTAVKALPQPGRYTHDNGNTITYAHQWDGDHANIYRFFGDLDPEVGNHILFGRDSLLIDSPRGQARVALGDMVVYTIGQHTVGLYDFLDVGRFYDVFTEAPLSPIQADFAQAITRAIRGIDPIQESLTGVILIEKPEIAELIARLTS